MTTAVLYARQSRTDDPERSASLDAQEADLRALADRRGWTVAGVYRDADAPADDLDRRTQWLELLEHCDRHPVDVVAAFDTSRLWRSVEMRYTMLRALSAAGVTTVATLAGDTTTDPTDDPEGGLVGTMLAAVAEYDNRLRRLKIRRAHEQAAKAGKPLFGGTRPYGYADDRVTVVEHERAVVREAARRVLAGETVGAVCNDLDRRGIRTVTGRPWRTTVLRRVLTSPRTAGQREHDGRTYPAVWEPLLDADTVKQVRAVLLDHRRRKGGRPRAYLLTGGTARCGRDDCGTALVARPKADGRRAYVCARGGNGTSFTGCGRLGALAEPLEGEVRDRVTARLDGDGLRRALAELARDQGGSVAELRAVERRLETLEADHYAGDVTEGGYQLARARLVDRVEVLRAELSRVDRTRVLVDLAASDDGVRATWDAQPMAWRRLLVAAVVERVTVAPAVRGRNTFDPDRVTVRWRV